MQTLIAFPDLGRTLTPDLPDQVCLAVYRCEGVGIAFARWHDQPDYSLRLFDIDRGKWLEPEVPPTATSSG
jgi:hypothetical protein